MMAAGPLHIRMCWRLLLVLPLFLVACKPALSLLAPVKEYPVSTLDANGHLSKQFTISHYFADEDGLRFPLYQEGRLVFSASWDEADISMALLLNADGQAGYKVRKVGRKALSGSYSVNAWDLQKTQTWKVTLVNDTGKGPVHGVIHVQFITR